MKSSSEWKKNNAIVTEGSLSFSNFIDDKLKLQITYNLSLLITSIALGTLPYRMYSKKMFASPTSANA